MAAAGLLCLYLALMGGHLYSIDGLVMWRQSLAMTYHLSWSFTPPIWWGGVITSSGRGIGASLEYTPGLAVFAWLAGHVPVQAGQHYDFNLLYADLLYIVGGEPVWPLVTAVTALLVGLTASTLGLGRRLALWAMAFYGLGSPALAAARGDWPQPLVALCWAAGVYGCVRYTTGGGRRWLWLAAIAVFYGVLDRPLEGSMLLPAVVLLLMPRWRLQPLLAAPQVGAWAAGVAVTLLTNWARFGSPTNLGYGSSLLAWTTPIWVGLPGALVSPGRGVVWEVPALLLAVPGARYLWGRGRQLEAAVMVALPAVLLLEASLYVDWIGGWDWGFRFFQPALPLVAVLAAAGVPALPRVLRGWLPAVLLAGGVLWNVPVVLTDLLGGYGSTYATVGPNWSLDAYPPIGAWRFLHHIRPVTASDSHSIDIVWVRATRYIGVLALVPFIALMVGAAGLWWAAIRRVASEPAAAPTRVTVPRSPASIR